MKKTILFATPRMLVGGAETYIFQKARYLREKGFDVYILSQGGEWKERAEKISNGHIEVEWINEDPTILNKEKLLNRLIILSNIIDKYNIDLIEVNQMFPAVYFNYLSKIKKTPLIFNVLSEISFIRNTYIDLIREMDEKNLYFNVAYGCNRDIENFNKAKFKNCNIINIPFEVNNEGKCNCIDDKFILTVARLEKEKMYVKNLAIDFVDMCIENNIENLKLYIVGDGNKKKEVLKLVNKLNKKLINSCKIVMLGRKTEEELQTLFLNCSIYVGMGTTLVNAGYYKKPSIIATYYPNDISRGYGYFNYYNDKVSIGQIIPGMKKESYKKLMIDLLNDEKLYNDMSLKAYELYKNEFCLESVMEMWMKVYNNENYYRKNVESDIFYVNKNLKYMIKLFFYKIKVMFSK